MDQETIKKLDDTVLKLLHIKVEEKNLTKLCVKARAVAAVAEWLRVERVQRLAPL